MDFKQPLSSILEKHQNFLTSSPAMPPDLASLKSELKARLQDLLTTINPKATASQTGGQLSVPGAEMTSNIPPEIPAKLAEDCVTTRLPSSVQWRLDDMVYNVQNGLVKYPAAPKPQLTEAEMETCRFEIAMLELITQPAFHKGHELTAEIGLFLSIWPFGIRHDAGLMGAKVNEWAADLERFPLYAIRRSFGYWKRTSKREPSFSEVLSDVRLFTGSDVLLRKRLLEQVLTESSSASKQPSGDSPKSSPPGR